MKFLNIIFLFATITVFSQSKVGTVDIDYILSKMPELAGVQTTVTEYGNELDVDLNAKVKSFEEKLAAYKKVEKTIDEATKKAKQEELIALESEIKKFQQNGTQLINIKQDEALRPLYQKIADALERVVKAQGYTQVLQINQDVVYSDPNYDVTIAVLKDLGITVKE